jgi:hypothetical protein
MFYGQVGQVPNKVTVPPGPETNTGNVVEQTDNPVDAVTIIPI